MTNSKGTNDEPWPRGRAANDQRRFALNEGKFDSLTGNYPRGFCALISSCSQAREKTQWRLAVRSEMSRASEACSIVMPIEACSQWKWKTRQKNSLAR
jgi:hypothetical protein